MLVDQPLSGVWNPRSRWSLTVSIAGLAGVVAIFLPFTFDTSPLTAAAQFPLWPHERDWILGSLWRLGLPLMLPILVSVGNFRWAAAGRLPRAERLAAYVAALLAELGFLSLFLPFGSGEPLTAPSSFREWVMLLAPWVGSAAGAFLLWRNRRAGVPDAANAIAAMQVAYTIVAVFCLVTFEPARWQVGAYVAALTAVLYLIQIVSLSAFGRVRSRI